MSDIEKFRQAALRRSLASWQRAAIGLFALGVVTSAVCSGLLVTQQRETERIEAKYRAAQTGEREAVEAYGRLLAEVETEREARAAQTAAYEALAGCQYIGECAITYYCCEAYEHICGTGDGLTATGIPAAPGIVAVDPAVIPLGSTVIIDGTSYLAADTGALVKGNHIDIAVATHDEALEKGIGTAEVWIIPAGEN